MDEHIFVGTKYSRVKLNTTYSLGLTTRICRPHSSPITRRTFSISSRSFGRPSRVGIRCGTRPRTRASPGLLMRRSRAWVRACGKSRALRLFSLRPQGASLRLAYHSRQFQSFSGVPGGRRSRAPRPTGPRDTCVPRRNLVVCVTNRIGLQSMEASPRRRFLRRPLRCEENANAKGSGARLAQRLPGSVRPQCAAPVGGRERSRSARGHLDCFCRRTSDLRSPMGRQQ
jgi:hypothetical protein